MGGPLPIAHKMMVTDLQELCILGNSVSLSSFAKRGELCAAAVLVECLIAAPRGLHEPLQEKGPSD